MPDLPISLLPSSSIPSGSYVLSIVNNGVTLNYYLIAPGYAGSVAY